MDALFNILPTILDRIGDSDDLRAAIVFAAWKRIAGESLRMHTVCISLEEKRLVIAVRDDTWKKHLEALAAQMIFKINSALRNSVVTFIDFQVDESAFKDDIRRSGRNREMAAHKLADALGEITPELRAAAEDIENENLRDETLLAAANCLVRKKRIAKESER